MPTPTRITIALPSDVRSLDPAEVQDTVSFVVANQVYEGLTRFSDATIEIEAGLAESWTSTPDHRSWTFRLRPNVAFSDGTLLTAEVAVESLRRSPELGAKIVADGLSVVFTFPAPAAHLPVTLAQMPFALTKPGGTFGRVGTGPYRHEARKVAREILLVRNSSQHRYRPVIDEVFFRIIPFTTLVSKGLVDGDIDLTDSVTPAMLPILRREERIRLHFQMGLNTGFLALNTERAPLSDVRVRTAIACAVDRTPMLQHFFPTGYGEPAATLLPTQLYRGKVKAFHQYDPQRARQILEAAGYRGEPIRVRPTWAPRPYLPDPPAISSEICRQLRAAGFTVSEQPSPSTEEYARLKSSGDFDVLVAGWIADDTIPTTYYVDNLSSAKVGSTNIPRYRNPTVDQLLGRMKVLTGPALMQACEEMEEILQRDVPLVPLFHGPQMAAAAERVVGRILHPASALRVWNLSFSGTGTSRLSTGSLRSPLARPT